MTIQMTLVAVPDSMTANNSCKWEASTQLGGEMVSAVSRRDPERRLGRVLVAMGVRDQRVEVIFNGVLALRFKSLHTMALFTLAETSTAGFRCGKYVDQAARFGGGEEDD